MACEGSKGWFKSLQHCTHAGHLEEAPGSTGTLPLLLCHLPDPPSSPLVSYLASVCAQEIQRKSRDRIRDLLQKHRLPNNRASDETFETINLDWMLMRALHQEDHVFMHSWNAQDDPGPGYCNPHHFVDEEPRT